MQPKETEGRENRSTARKNRKESIFEKIVAENFTEIIKDLNSEI